MGASIRALLRAGMTKKKQLSRRSFLETVVISAGAASLGPSVLTACGGASRPVGEAFPQSLASGDPRTDSIVLWTRALPEDPGVDSEIRLELSTEDNFSFRFDLGDLDRLTARVDHDHCVRVKVTGLDAGTTYFYRFVSEGTRSNTGRFRTADPPSANVGARFAVLSCQDYVGKYYNSLLRLLDEDHDNLTFVLHLGDYVYETTGDPGFMTSSPDRLVELRNPEEAIALGSDTEPFYAAKSVGNYRDLYRTYRSDPVLQQVHERFAFICIWDDHEYSDDCYGANATYTDGVLDELDVDRRVNAEQAYFEYMPIALDAEGDGALAVDRSTLYPNTALHRSFRFGQNLTLAVTDYRSKRPDHPTPEDAYPGAVILDQAQTRATLAQQETDGDLPDGVTADMAFASGGFRSYVDLDDAAFADHATALELLLTGAYQAEGVEASRAAELAARYATGKTDAAILQGTIDDGRASLPAALMGVSAIDPADPALEVGLPYALLGKTDLVGQLGARYLTVQRTYDLVHAWRTRVNGDDAHDDVLGTTQEAWLATALEDSDATWKVVGNSVCNTSLILDLGRFVGSLPPGLPPERFYLNADQWDGFPERRRRLMRDIYAGHNAVLLAGDIHGAYATDFGEDADSNRVVELTTSSVSSGTFHELLLRTGNSVPAIRESGLLAPVLDALDSFMTDAFDPLQFAESNLNGVLVVFVNEVALEGTFHLISPATSADSYYDRADVLEGQWEPPVTFRVAKTAGKNGPLLRL